MLSRRMKSFVVAKFTIVAVEPGRWEFLMKHAINDLLTIESNITREARCALSTMLLSSVSLVAYMCMLDVGCDNAGYKKMVRGLIWTCQQCTDSKSEVQSKCTLKSEVTAKPEDDAAESKEPKTETKCVFTNRQELMQHARDHGWTTRSGQRGSPRMYFVCQKSLKTNADGKSEGCTVTFKAKAHSVSAILPDGVNIEDVEWCAVNMPTQHDCCKHVLQTALTTRVCRLPRDTYQEIQRLACCKSFNSQSIQQYIKFRYGLIVDVTLIYNIGYRARTKIGIGDVGLLLEQQTVRVYTSTSLSRILTQIAETTS